MSAGTDLKVGKMTIPGIITQAKYAVEHAIQVAEALPGDKIMYAYVPRERITDALNIDDDEVKEVKRTHPHGAYLWVEYYPSDAHTPWRLGVYWPDELYSEDPVVYQNKYEVMWRMLDDVEFFIEPRPPSVVTDK